MFEKEVQWASKLIKSHDYKTQYWLRQQSTYQTKNPYQKKGSSASLTWIIYVFIFDTFFWENFTKFWVWLANYTFSNYITLSLYIF